MKTRRKKPSARVTAARKPAVAQKRAAATSSKAARPAPSVAAPLGTDCTIEHAPALHKRLGKLLPNRACITLDFSTLKRCDTAGLQVLVAFIRERREAGRPLEMKGVQDNFLATAKLLGLSALFGPDMQEGRAAHAGHA
jgi:ABC-type transporter Mla MlaB component